MDSLKSSDHQSIYQKFKDIKQNAGDKHVCFIIDDLTVLTTNSEKLSDVLSFVKYCRSLISSQVILYFFHFKYFIVSVSNSH